MRTESRQTPAGSRYDDRMTPTGSKPAFSYDRTAARLSRAGSVVTRWCPCSRTRRSKTTRIASVPTPRPWTAGSTKMSIQACRKSGSFLSVLDHPSDLSVDEDREAGRLRLVLRKVGVLRAPPPSHFGRCNDLSQPIRVGLRERTEGYLVALQHVRRVSSSPTRPARRRLSGRDRLRHSRVPLETGPSL